MPTLGPPPPVNQDVDSRQYKDWFYSIYALLATPGSTLGTMAYQNYDNVNITGGQISNVGLTSVRTNGLSGYLKGNGSASPITASTTIPWSDITGAPSFTSPSVGAFHYDYTTTLTSSISSSATTIPVASTTGFSTTGAIIIENEIITYTGITSNSFTGCTRGAYASNATSHASGLYVGGAQGTTANTATLLQINTTDISNGVTLTASSEAQVSKAGTYNIQFSVQTFNCGNAPDNFTIWYRLNGSNVANSASIATTPAVHSGIPGAGIITVNLFLTLAANDKVQLYWTTNSGDTTVVTYPPSTTSPIHPASPAVILTVNQVA
jgi:hypothetical protein